MLYFVVRIMESPKIIFLAISLLLSGCLFQSSEPDPYGGLSCEEKIAKMTRELQAFEAGKKPLAKVSFVDSVTTSSADGDSIPGDTNQIPVDSTRTPIQVFRGFPPVTGVSGDTPNPITLPIDSRPTTVDGTSANNGYGVQWIPPVGYSDSGKTIPGPIPARSPIPEAATPTSLPKNITTVQIISSGAYKAHIRILDYKQDLVRELDQEFGYKGELDNPYRAVPNGVVSYLVWDNLTASGTRAQDGVYLWKVRLTFESKLVENQTAKTGLLGEECEPKP